jgi:putative ABC transport system permease protein
MSLTAFIGSMELGLVYSLLAFGTFISYRILRVADLTVDGSFVLGAAASAMLTLEGMPFAGILAAMAAGAIAGVITALLQTKMGIQPILAGILTMTGLYSINLMVMGGKANIPLLNNTNIFTPAENFGGRAYKIIVLTAIITLIFMLLNWFFRTLLGLSIRATGDNEDMCKASSINTDLVKIVGFALSNSIVALSGALLAQMQQSADVNMGSGMVVISFASLIIGSAIIKNKNITMGLGGDPAFTGLIISSIFVYIVSYLTGGSKSKRVLTVSEEA